MEPTRTQEGHHNSHGGIRKETIGSVLHSVSEYIIRPGHDRFCTDFIDMLGLSVHAYIMPDGLIARSLGEHLIAHHAGESMVQVDGKEHWFLNRSTLGAEFVVEGHYDLGSFHKQIRKSEAYTEEQYRSGGWLYAGWALEYNFTRQDVWGHSFVAGDGVRGDGRGKQDPGRGFDRDRFNFWFIEWTKELQ